MSPSRASEDVAKLIRKTAVLTAVANNIFPFMKDEIDRVAVLQSFGKSVANGDRQRGVSAE